MFLRPARHDELEAVYSLIQAGKQALADLGIDQWQGGNPTRDEIARDIQAGYTLVATDGETDALLGTLAFCDNGEADYDRVRSGAWLRDLRNVLEDGRAEYVTLHRLAVNPAARRQGVATFMMTECIRQAHADGFVSVRADTHEGNAPMRHIFETCGMQFCCVIDIAHPLEPTKKRLGYEILL